MKRRLIMAFLLGLLARARMKGTGVAAIRIERDGVKMRLGTDSSFAQLGIDDVGSLACSGLAPISSLRQVPASTYVMKEHQA